MTAEPTDRVDVPGRAGRAPERGPRRDGQGAEWWQPGFDLVLRGYDRAQVEDVLDRAEAEIRMIAADRDGMVRAEAAARAELATVRAELARVVRSPLSADGLSHRLRHLLRLAEQEADHVRGSAALAARTLVAQARERAAAIVADAEQRARAHGEEAADRTAAETAELRGRAEQELAAVLTARRRAADEALGEQERLLRDVEQRRQAAEAELGERLAAGRRALEDLECRRRAIGEQLASLRELLDGLPGEAPQDLPAPAAV